jgi:hypothetical protein
MKKVKSGKTGKFSFNAVKKFPGLLYRHFFRKILPTVEYQTFADVKVNPIKIGDKYLPSKQHVFDQLKNPDYETALVRGLNEYVKDGDKVVIVGGGKGVTTCIASVRAGIYGRVICYEASRESYKRIKKTLSYNSSPGNIEVINKCVGEPVSVWGQYNDEDIFAPADLPECDVLELDCEGAEKKIILEMAIRPDIILVETHGLYNSSTVEIEELLKDLDYKIESISIADIRSEEYCLKNDIMVIVARR